MYLLSRAQISMIIPGQVLDWVEHDDWARALAWPETQEQKAYLAAVAMDAGHVEGLRYLLAHGLSAGSTVSAKHLRQSGYPARVPLLRLVSDLCAPGIRDEATTGFLEVLFAHGAKPDIENLALMVGHGDTKAVECCVRHAPDLLDQAHKANKLSAQIKSAPMMDCLLGLGMPAAPAEEWIWRMDLEMGAAAVEILRVLANRSINLDAKYPFIVDHGRGDRSALEYYASPASLVDPDDEIVLAALVELGARISRLDEQDINGKLPLVEQALSARRALEEAVELQETTLPAVHPSRSHRF